MDRFWLRSYPPGVPSDIDPSVYPSVVALLEESFAKYRDSKAYVCMDKAITSGDIDTLSEAFAAWLRNMRPRQQAALAAEQAAGSATTTARAVLAAAQAAVRAVEEMLEQHAAAMRVEAEHKAQADIDEVAQRTGPIMQM